jgi:hypothetical protein
MSDENKNINEFDENQGLSSHDLNEDDIRKAVMNQESGSGFGNVNQGSNSEDRANIESDPYLENAKRMQEFTGKQGLGNVKSIRGEEDAPNSDMLLGWHRLFIEDMPSEGRYYPAGMSVHIRAARAAEIRHWSTMNERDLFDIDDKLNHIVQNCTKVQSEKRMMSWKDILEEDRIHLILAIRDLTFKEGENKLSVGNSCPHCGTKNTIEISNQTLQSTGAPTDIERYYDPEERLYNIQTRSYGTIRMKPPSIGVMSVVTKFISTKQKEGGYWDQSYLQIFPYMHLEWRGLNEKSIFDGEVSFQGWDEKKYMLLYRIAEKMRVGVQPEISTECTGCGEEVTAQIDFRNGIKAIFIPTISDITDELL